MRIRTVLLVVFALVCGGSAALGVSQLNQRQVKSDTTSIVVVNRTVDRGTLLDKSMIDIQQWPRETAPEGTLASLDEVTGKTAIVPMVKGEAVLQSKLASDEAARGLASMIPPGMRAFTIQTPHAAAGGGGFILPGNRVDVLLTTSSSGHDDPTGGGATTTLLQNVQVLAVAQRLEAPESNKVDPQELKSVTLLVSPHQAATLDLGMNKGILHLSLRNPEDEHEADTRPVTMNGLRFRQEKPLNGVLQLTRFIADKFSRQETVENEPVVRHVEIRTLRGNSRGSVRVRVPN